MKSKMLFLMLFVIVLGSAKAQFSSEKTLVMSIPSESVFIHALLPGKVEVKEWDKDFSRLSVSIHINMDADILSKLVLGGRYRLENYVSQDVFFLTMPKMERHLIIQGVEVVEHLTFVLQVPAGSSVSTELPSYLKGRGGS